jgi:hypothetical protein
MRAVLFPPPLVTLLRQDKQGASARAQVTELVNDKLRLVAALAGSIGACRWAIP